MIHNEEAFKNSIWNWDILKGCFSATKTAVMDIDGILERHNQFIVFETKSLNSTVSMGQQLTFEAMQRTGVFTVVIVWGKRNEPQFYKVFYSNGYTTDKMPCTLADMRALVDRWYKYANKC